MDSYDLSSGVDRKQVLAECWRLSGLVVGGLLEVTWALEGIERREGPDVNVSDRRCYSLKPVQSWGSFYAFVLSLHLCFESLHVCIDRKVNANANTC